MDRLEINALAEDIAESLLTNDDLDDLIDRIVTKHTVHLLRRIDALERQAMQRVLG